ncbi:MAG TPA: AMP-binding protein, partial [Verrucomicrobiae bacterium]|nr:AMP-binding protein [Verrucomicrobiae bacterium]
MPVEGTIRALLDNWDPQAIAIAAPDRAPLTRGQLAAQMDATIASLRALGIGRQDRVAMVLPNGPEMAALFLGVAAGAASAPLNAAYREEEFDFYLSDIEAKLLLIEAGMESPARAVAARRGIPVVDVAPDLAAPAGSYRLIRDGAPVAAGKLGAGEFGGPGDVALVLHTSGTTSRPKIVPLSHANLTASARNIGRTLGLEPSDRCLVIMPLFHIHGLVGALLASIAAGASLFCPP